MRLGAPVYNFRNAEEWAARHKEKNYGAAYWTLGSDASKDEIDAYVKAAADNNIIIAEVGAWSNIIADDQSEKSKNIQHNIERLKTADLIGAKCCVNIAGTKAKKWDGYDARNYSSETFREIVETVQCIIDTAKPSRTYYTIELMPWAIPDSADAYLELIEKVKRPNFAVHLDPVNIITSPRAFCFNAEIINDMFAKLGKYIRSVHAKDVVMADSFISHLSEVRPGLGSLCYDALLKNLNELDDVPLMIEHLSTEEDYSLAAEYIFGRAKENNLTFAF